jgi:hypothetical protein
VDPDVIKEGIEKGKIVKGRLFFNKEINEKNTAYV